MTGKRGFTLIELLVVMTIIAMLLTLATPRYFGNVNKAKEAVLREDLATLRDSLDKYMADTGKYPGSLDDLVTFKYLRDIPADPFTESNATWITSSEKDPQQRGISDIRSGAPGRARDGTRYVDW